MKELSPDQIVLLNKPLDAAAIGAPNNKGLSSIKAIYVTERLNEVFGVGSWQTRVELIETSKWSQSTRSGDRDMYTGLVKTTFDIPDYNIHYECIASSNNDDEGDAIKGAITDSISKIASWMNIGIDVYKGKITTHEQKPQAVSNTDLGNCPKCGSPLVEQTTKTGKKMTKCSTNRWNAELKQPEGCDYVVWGSPKPQAEEEDYPLSEPDF